MRVRAPFHLLTAETLQRGLRQKRLSQLPSYHREDLVGQSPSPGPLFALYFLKPRESKLKSDSKEHQLLCSRLIRFCKTWSKTGLSDDTRGKGVTI